MMGGRVRAAVSRDQARHNNLRRVDRTRADPLAEREDHDPLRRPLPRAVAIAGRAPPSCQVYWPPLLR